MKQIRVYCFFKGFVKETIKYKRKFYFILNCYNNMNLAGLILSKNYKKKYYRSNKFITI